MTENAVDPSTTPTLVLAPLPPVRGTPAITQGRYGSVGNLELVAPAIDGGLWVCWYNSDPIESGSGAATRCWSGALHFAGDAELDAATITQMTAGPDYLEVLATGDGLVHRYCWSPAAGFVEHPGLGTGTACSTLIEQNDNAHVLLVRAGELVHAYAAMADYPVLDWQFTSMGHAAEWVGLAAGGAALTGLKAHQGQVELIDLSSGDAVGVAGHWGQPQLLSTGEIIGLDISGQLQRLTTGAFEPLWAGEHWNAVAGAVTNLDGGRIDVVARRGDRLWHGPIGDEPLQCLQSKVWSTDPAAPIHRREPA